MNRSNTQILENLISKVVKKVIREEISLLKEEINSLKESILDENNNTKSSSSLKESTKSDTSEQQRLMLRNKFNKAINYTGNNILNGLLNETSPLDESEVNSILDTPQNNKLDEILNRDYSQLMETINNKK